MTLLDVLFYAFCGVVFFQVIFYLFFYGKFAFNTSKKEALKQPLPPISVIVYAKNQATALQSNLPYIVSQNYPKFEIVLVNNASLDQTLNVMEAFKTQQPQTIKIVNVKNNEAFWGSKKYALTLGIKAASYDHLLFTESNYKPLSQNWIREMGSKFSTKKDILIGFVTYAKKNSLFNKLLRYDNVIDTLTTFSFAKSGSPIKGNAGNLGYTKSTFFNINGFINHIKLPYGEASLFINQAATAKNTSTCVSPNSFTQQEAPSTFLCWKQHKQLLLKTAKHFKPLHKGFLMFRSILQFLFWVLAVVLLASMFQWQLVLALFLFRVSLQITVIGLSAKKLNQGNVCVLLPFFEVFLLLTQITIFITQLTATRNH